MRLLLTVLRGTGSLGLMALLLIVFVLRGFVGLLLDAVLGALVRTLGTIRLMALQVLDL